MCGIVGYVGRHRADAFLLEGLRRLEYRGYDSAGIATLTDDRRFHVAKAVGRIESLAARIEEQPLPGTTGIGHTRWATHGVPSEANAHPHFGGQVGQTFLSAAASGRQECLPHECPVLALAHNGVIE